MTSTHSAVSGGQSSFLIVEDVSLKYPGAEGVLALERLDLSVNQGEFAAMVGPSGCGKSTLMKLISGLNRPTVGRVLVGDVEVRAPLKNVGMAFQNPALLPWRTTLENLLLPLQVARPHRERFRQERKQYVEKAQGLLAKVGLAGVGNRYPWELSGGMQQRVSLCRALIHQPQILLLDEPFGALDAFTREELWDTLQTLWQEQRFTVLLVTHDLTEAVYLADFAHVISSRPGRVIYRCRIDLPRPRGLEMRYTPIFVDYVHDLRAHIGRARHAS